MQIDATTYQRVLGDEIRRLRKRRGLTRKQLNERLQSDISLQTLATYELGTRHCTVLRFVEICVALDELPHELMARVHERVFADAPRGRIRVDLRKLARDPQPDLLPLHRWAKGRLAQTTSASAAEVQLDFAALERMAELCGVETVELIRRLRQIGASNYHVPTLGPQQAKAGGASPGADHEEGPGEEDPGEEDPGANTEPSSGAGPGTITGT